MVLDMKGQDAPIIHVQSTRTKGALWLQKNLSQPFGVGEQGCRWARGDGDKAAAERPTVEAMAEAASAHGPERSIVDRALGRAMAEGRRKTRSQQCHCPRASIDAVREGEGVEAHAGMQLDATM